MKKGRQEERTTGRKINREEGRKESTRRGNEAMTEKDLPPTCGKTANPHLSHRNYVYIYIYI